MNVPTERFPKVPYIDPKIGVWHTVKLTVVGKTITAELDSRESQNLQIINEATASALSANGQPFDLAGKRFKHTLAGSAMLIENGKLIGEVIDELPKSAR